DNSGKNLFCSPHSIYVALAMTAEGARGETALEMGVALRLPAGLRREGDDGKLVPWDLAPVHEGLAALNKRLAASAAYELKVANALWLDKKCMLRKAYLDVITGQYRGGV